MSEEKDAGAWIDQLQWELILMSEEQAQKISNWRYPVPYEVYNWPDWAEMVRNEEEFADPAVREQQYYACVDENGSLCGFVQLFPMAGVVRIGLGLAPQLCGKGLGNQLTRLAVREAQEKLKKSEMPDASHWAQASSSSRQPEIDLEVLTWNIRAIRVYKRCGFEITDTYERTTRSGMAEVHCMVWNG